MKKLFMILALAVLTASAAHAQFFYGAQFGFYTDGNAKATTDGLERGATTYNISVKPSIGYFFTPKFVVGLKLNYTSCSYVNNDTGSLSMFDVNYYVNNLLMGNGLSRDYMSFKVSPYVRYQVFSMFDEKLKLWAELDGYWGMKYPRDTEHKIDAANRSMIYGVELHPLVSYDIMDKYMIYTSLDFLSFSWDGEAKRNTDSAGDPYTDFKSTMLFQCNPLIAVAHAFINIGVMRKF